MIENAKITKVSLTMAEHGCLTFWVWVEMQNGACGIGGYCIGHGHLDADHFDGDGRGLVAMARIMDTVGVENWEDLKGEYCRVDSEGWGGKIIRIGNLIRDKWFDLPKFFAKEG